MGTAHTSNTFRTTCPIHKVIRSQKSYIKHNHKVQITTKKWEWHITSMITRLQEDVGTAKVPMEDRVKSQGGSSGLQLHPLWRGGVPRVEPNKQTDS